MYKRGISLTALVVTVIIMILLAGISMTALFGDNGVVKQAMKSKENTEYAAAREMVELAWSARMNKFLEEGSINLSDPTIRETYLATLKSELNENLGNAGKIVGNIEYDEENNTFKIMYQNNKGNNFAVEIARSGLASVLGQVEQDVTEENANEVLKNYIPKVQKDRVSLYGSIVTTGVETVVGRSGNVDLEELWKVFYIDDNNVYLIYGDYYPNNALINLDDTMHTTEDFYDLYVSKQGEYDSTRNTEDPGRTEMLDYLGNSANWSNITDAFTTTGKTFESLSGTSNIIAYGTPTVEMWIDSYNEYTNKKYGNEGLNLGYNSSVRKGDAISLYSYEAETLSDITAPAPGVAITAHKDADPIVYSWILPNKTTSRSHEDSMDSKSVYSEGGVNGANYVDNLYYPRKSSIWIFGATSTYVTGYWLRSGSAEQNDFIYFAFRQGNIGRGEYWGTFFAVRPIVQISRTEYERIMNIEITN